MADAHEFPENLHQIVIAKAKEGIAAVVAGGRDIHASRVKFTNWCEAAETRRTHAFADANLKIEPTFLSNSIESMKFLAASGEAVAFLSRFDIAEKQRNAMLSYIRVRDRSIAPNMMSLVHRSKRAPGLAASLLAEDLRQALHAATDERRKA